MTFNSSGVWLSIADGLSTHSYKDFFRFDDFAALDMYFHMVFLFPDGNNLMNG
jgi:hypothetical protein